MSAQQYVFGCNDRITIDGVHYRPSGRQGRANLLRLVIDNAVIDTSIKPLTDEEYVRLHDARKIRIEEGFYSYAYQLLRDRAAGTDLSDLRPQRGAASHNRLEGRMVRPIQSGPDRRRRLRDAPQQDPGGHDRVHRQRTGADPSLVHRHLRRVATGRPQEGGLSAQALRLPGRHHPQGMARPLRGGRPSARRLPAAIRQVRQPAAARSQGARNRRARGPQVRVGKQVQAGRRLHPGRGGTHDPESPASARMPRLRGRQGHSPAHQEVAADPRRPRTSRSQGPSSSTTPSAREWSRSTV